MRSREWRSKWGDRKSKIWKENNIYSASNTRIQIEEMAERWRGNNKWLSGMDRRRVRDRGRNMNGDKCRI